MWKSDVSLIRKRVTEVVRSERELQRTPVLRSESAIVVVQVSEPWQRAQGLGVTRNMPRPLPLARQVQLQSGYSHGSILRSSGSNHDFQSLTTAVKLGHVSDRLALSLGRRARVKKDSGRVPLGTTSYLLPPPSLSTQCMKMQEIDTNSSGRGCEYIR